MKIFISIFFFAFVSCINSKYPTNTKKYSGGVMTCVTDSTTLMVAPVIKIKKELRPLDADGHTFCVNCKYAGCDNVPGYIDRVEIWPGRFSFNFKEKSYFFLNKPRPFKPELKYDDVDFAVAYDVDYGKISYNKKEKIIILVSGKYNVTRTYNYNYSEQDSVLTLNIK